MRLRDKVAIITGSGQGAGQAMAVRFAEEGAKVVIAEINQDTGRETEQIIHERGFTATYIHTDITSIDSINQMVSQTAELYGHINILVNNVGLYQFKSLLEVTEKDFDFYINVNLKGGLFCSKEVIPYMQRNGGGSIINLSSFHSLATTKNAEIYAASKGGVNALTRGMAQSFGADGIRVNAICPGYIYTQHYDTWLNSFEDRSKIEGRINALHPIGRIPKREEVANLALFLASDESQAITGTCQVIDGGITSNLYFEEDNGQLEKSKNK
jgi:NAD(P)-dependent dehydrogenase (short-subunit alcohol dehydrogenase family)